MQAMTQTGTEAVQQTVEGAVQQSGVVHMLTVLLLTALWAFQSETRVYVV